MSLLSQVIYLDYQATTPMDEFVWESMRPYFREDFGNASSIQHAFGWSAQKAVELAREQVARLIGAKSRELIFTSGATEAINWIFFALIEQARTSPTHVIISQAEHSAVLGAAERAQAWGVEVDILPVDRLGRIRVADVEACLKPHTQLVSLIHANNEVGTLNPIAEVAKLVRPRGVWLHADSCQAVGKVPVQVDELGVDLLSCSAHKMYGPKGVGALYVRSQNPRVSLKPLLVGGGQERGLRAGTLNVPGIVGLGAACELAHQRLHEDIARITELRQLLHRELARLPNIRFNGCEEQRIPGNLSVTFEGVTAGDLYPFFKKLAISTGSACASQEAKPSHVLLAMGLTEIQARSTLRLGLGRPTTREEIFEAAEQISRAVQKIRARSGG